jgi:hypothetical protein
MRARARVWVCVCVCVHRKVHAYACTLWAYACIYACMYAFMYVCIYAPAHVYIHQISVLYIRTCVCACSRIYSSMTWWIQLKKRIDWNRPLDIFARHKCSLAGVSGMLGAGRCWPAPRLLQKRHFNPVLTHHVLEDLFWLRTWCQGSKSIRNIRMLKGYAGLVWMLCMLVWMYGYA